MSLRAVRLTDSQARYLSAPEGNVYETTFYSNQYRFRSIIDIEFPQNRVHVKLDRRLTDEQFFCDTAVSSTLGQTIQDFQLTVTE